MPEDLRETRLQHLQQLCDLGIPVYPDSFKTDVTLAAARSLGDGQEAAVAGRIISIRAFGKLIFMHIQDASGSLQVGFEKKTLPDETFYWVSKLTDIGDFVGVRGRLFTTRTGEKTLGASEVVFLGKALRPLPEKWHGLTDKELRYRKRYLDLISNEDTRRVFHTRSKIISFIRNYLEHHDFVEVETPILQPSACGASARPFLTHHNTLDQDFYLRISPETYLKRLIVGGLNKVYELGRNFRNEGLDSSHLQEFTMLEYYAAYWNYRDNMQFIRNLIQATVQEFCGSLVIEYRGTGLDFSGEWEERKYNDLILEETGIDLTKVESIEHLKSLVREKRIDLDVDKYISRASLIDGIYKKKVRPRLVQPMFLTSHPAELVPLARRNNEVPSTLDMFQVLVNSWEIVKAYSELVDPIEQKDRLEEQSRLREAGDEEAMMLEPDYIECMEYGMPPVSGLGLGIDRFVAILTNSESLRDVVFFPQMRWEGSQ